jgi:hypothetical protein
MCLFRDTSTRSTVERCPRSRIWRPADACVAGILRWIGWTNGLIESGERCRCDADHSGAPPNGSDESTNRLGGSTYRGLINISDPRYRCDLFRIALTAAGSRENNVHWNRRCHFRARVNRRRAQKGERTSEGWAVSPSLDDCS